MAVFTIPGWLENAGAVHTAVQMRNYIGAILDGTSGSVASLKPRGGVHPRLGTQLAVSETGSPSMAVDVTNGAAWIPGTEASAQGLYGFFNDATVTLSITTAHATLPRIDIVQARIRDSFYSGANNDALLDVKAGTPGSSPVAPSADPNAIVLAQVLVGAGVTSIVNANITDTRFYYSGVGGVMIYRFDANPPSSTDIDQGMLFWSVQSQKLQTWDGTSLHTIWDRNVEGIDLYERKIKQKTAAETLSSSTTLQNDNDLFLPVVANSRYSWTARILLTSPSAADFKLDLSLPAGATHRSTAISYHRVVPQGGQGADTRTFYDTETVVINTDGTTFTSQSIIMQIDGTISTSGTAGNAQIRWAQNTSDAGTTSVFVESYMTLTRHT